MRSILLFVLIFCLVSRNKFTSSVTVQSIFFVSALVKSGIFAESQIKLRKNIIFGALILISGFALSTVITLYSASEDLPKYILLSLTTFGFYLCCYSFLIAMHRHFKSGKPTKTTTLICTLFPSIASIYSSNVSPFLTVMLIIAGSIALYFTIMKTKKDATKTPLRRTQSLL